MTKHFGSLLLNNEIFKPNKYNKGFPDDVYNQNNQYKYVLDKNDLRNEYIKYTDFPHELSLQKKHFIVDMFLNLKTIGENGKINPLKRWVIDAIYDMYEM